MSDTIKSKRCSHCKQIKPISNFYKDRSRKDGYDHKCKRCNNQYHQYNDKQHERSHRYYQLHRSEILERAKKCYSTNQYQHYKKHNREKERQYERQYRNTIKGHLSIVWHNMLQRCNSPRAKGYKNYGGRGIKVKFACFKDFFNYVKELKADPTGLTIDRIDNNGHYETGNIRFVTHRENCQNRKKRTN